jgi:serine/threonine protein phosphatase 1
MAAPTPTRPRVLAIGDVHGCLIALDRLLELVQPRPEDTVVVLGDVVDRGPDSRGVIDRLLRLRDQTKLVVLQGNHEQMMLEARREPAAVRSWLVCGGKEALASYRAFGTLDDVPDSHWEFLEQTRDYYEMWTHVFVHANLAPHVPMDEQPGYLLRWEPIICDVRHYSGKKMVCGHTSQKSGLPRNFGRAVCIDTWAYGKGWLTCLDVATERIWQTNQRGEQRTGWLPDAEEGEPDEE